MNSKVKESLKDGAVGAGIGCAVIVPGISGGTIALVTGAFKKIVTAVDKLFSKLFWKNLAILIPFGVGAVLAIAGNHDHWFYHRATPNEEKPDAVCLDHDYCEHYDGEYAFLGCTMWTPVGNDWMKWSCFRHMNDYNYIPHFKVDDSIK